MIVRTALAGSLSTFLAILLIAPTANSGETNAAKPIKALLITGGGYHDYAHQKSIMTEGVSARANVEWTIVHDTSTEDSHKIPLFEDPNWADGYDVVVHNECFANIDDAAYIDKVVAAHKNGTPAVVVHCAMHTFRALKSDEWHKFLGVSTFRHGKQHPLEVKNLKPENPILKGFPETWTTGNEELYWIEKVWPETTVLAQAKAEENGKDNPVIWSHPFGKGRVFGTTLAHNNRTMSDPVYLDMFTRGLLWAADKLGEDGKPKPGYEPSPGKAE
ncbi:ThuA domain-containing protein [Tundrisphaera lichenicola]|uniref:ThuA domain-containing protein n=1 Tax=Tundrisphaera lichenicola TaxID=2029860 RepID=UPI003EB9045A